MPLKTGDPATISVQALYNSISDRPAKTALGHEITHKGNYFDLHSKLGVACMDGETCFVESVNDDGSVTFRNSSGDDDTMFTLTAAEVATAMFA